MTTQFILYDKAGRILASEPSKCDHYARYSMRCAAEQKRLDALAVANPTAVRAEIVQASGAASLFTIAGGRTSHAGFRERPAPSPADLTAKERRRLRDSIEGDDPCMIYDAEQAMAEALADMESR